MEINIINRGYDNALITVENLTKNADKMKFILDLMNEFKFSPSNIVVVKVDKNESIHTWALGQV